MLVPLVLLATIATIIASQSIITGAYSMTRQAIQLGWLPRVQITQTSERGYGQIYVGAVNWLLMIVTLGLTIGFGKSDNLAAAYGIAVSATMLMTTVLLFIAMRETWRWTLPAAAAIASAFFIVDAAFLTANLAKITDGGYVPLLLAAAVYGVMLVWNTGAVNLYICALWGQYRPLHLISNDKSSAVVDYLNGFRICDRWSKQENRSQDGVPSSQRGDFTYMSLRLGGWDRRLVQDHGRLVPQLGRLGSASARGCDPCQGAARSVGVNVLDEDRPVDDLSAPFVVTGN